MCAQAPVGSPRSRRALCHHHHARLPREEAVNHIHQGQEGGKELIHRTIGPEPLAGHPPGVVEFPLYGVDEAARSPG